jgi:[ribosomal protein S5]-alanine N-acetyltransferase
MLLLLAMLLYFYRKDIPMVQLHLPEKIITDRLLIQRLRYEDADEIFYAYASKPEATKYVSWPTHQSVTATRGFLKYAIAAWNEGLDYGYSIRLKEANRLIGSFGIINENGKVQFGYILTPTQWGNGYATEVCLEMMQLLRNEKNVFRIGTCVDVENGASMRVLEKAGLVEEARLDNWMMFPNQGKSKTCALFVVKST